MPEKIRSHVKDLGPEAVTPVSSLFSVKYRLVTKQTRLSVILPSSVSSPNAERSPHVVLRWSQAWLPYKLQQTVAVSALFVNSTRIFWASAALFRRPVFFLVAFVF